MEATMNNLPPSFEAAVLVKLERKPSEERKNQQRKICRQSTKKAELVLSGLSVHYRTQEISISLT